MQRICLKKNARTCIVIRGEIIMKLSKDTLRYERILKEHRRALHRIPEISFDLPKTQAYILQTLNGIGGFELQKIAKSGVLARLN